MFYLQTIVFSKIILFFFCKKLVLFYYLLEQFLKIKEKRFYLPSIVVLFVKC